MIKKLNFVCYGCGNDRPCYVESNQEDKGFNDPIEDLKCILDETNQTGYKWEYAGNDSAQQTKKEICPTFNVKCKSVTDSGFCRNGAICPMV